tara:strand:- start:300 stop:923 length:624 start_codon:yes stop_codon:yes gene_type:complete
MNVNDELIKNLINAQIDIDHALKDAKNPFFKSQYATLEVVIDTAKDALNRHGIYFQQISKEYERGASVETVFYGHGGCLSTGSVQVPVDKFDPQAYGGALTYARRYSLSLACGISSKDDDAESAMQRDSKTGKYKILNSVSKPIASANTPEEYIALCRKYMGKNDAYGQNSYKKNEVIIKQALEDSSGKTNESFQKLIATYEVSTDE